MTLIKSKDAAVFNLPGVTFAGLASPSRGSTVNSAWRVTIAPNTPGGTHRLTREEIIVCISGSANATIGKDHHTVCEGDAIVVPADTDFALGNPNGNAFEAIAILPVGGQAIIGTDPAFTPPWAA
jgi:quercetin dioxygenase-like cupin family protein